MRVRDSALSGMLGSVVRLLRGESYIVVWASFAHETRV